ncbi:MAG: ricin-type beta-trefoil lectin domain protein, partial [bacterium]|nr:ricin-type beta-trefoil lectin domain protein [bacterium]
MKTITRSSLATALVLFWVPAVYGQGAVPLGGEFQINHYTTGEQRSASVAASADGGFVTVWSSYDSSNFYRHSVQGQRYAADGTPLGEQFQVSSTRVSPMMPSAATLADGGFVVLWHSYDSIGSDTYSASIQGRRYAVGGTPVGSEFQVNSYTTFGQLNPSVAALTDGGFVAVWKSFGSSGSDSSFFSIQGRRFTIDGTAVGNDFQVNSYTTSGQVNPSVASLAEGDFVVLWWSLGSSGSDASGFSIQGQRYASDGTAVGGEFQVNSYTTDWQTNASVAGLADGGFVTVWESLGSSGSDSSESSIQGQRYARDGTALGAEFQVNSDTHFSQNSPSVAALDNGGFVMAWQSWGSSGSDSSGPSIQGQLFSAGGEPLGGEFQINSYTTSYQTGPSVAAQVDGAFVALWHSNGSSGSDSSGYSVQGRSFAQPRFSLVGLGKKCLDIDHSGTTPDTPVILFSCHGEENQRWQLELSSLPQRVVGIGGQCLILGPVDDDGYTRAVMGECGDDVALWRLITDGHASPSLLVHERSGHCLDVRDNSTADFTPIILHPCHGGANQVWRPAAEVCTRDSLGLCLNQERFRVDLEWTSFDGSTGLGRAVPVGSDDSGLLWFFQAENWEMLIKVLDGCAINDRLWVFAAATTTVEYTLRVTDTRTPAVREYFNPLNNAAASITDTDAFDACPAGLASQGSGEDPHAGLKTAFESIGSSLGADTETGRLLEVSCVPSETGMCLRDRFQLEVTWRDHAGNVGPGRVIDAGTPESGMFWFFDPGN